MGRADGQGWYAYRRSLRLEENTPRRDVKDVLFQLQTNDAPGQNDSGQATRYISMKEVAKHSLAQDAWVVVDGKVYE